MCFEAVSANVTTATVSFSGTPTVQEVTTTAGEAVVDYNAGSVSITSGGGGNNDVTFNVESATVSAGESFC